MDLIGRWCGLSKEPRVVVTALVDGSARNLEHNALHRLQQLAEAVQDGDGSIVASVDIYRPSGSPQEKHDYLSRALAAEHPFPFGETWEGRRFYHIDAKAARRGVTALESAAEPLAAGHLARHLQANQKRYPNAFHLVYAFGHRQDYGAVAGMPLRDFGEALRGPRVGLVLLDTCYGSSLEVLRHIPRNVHTVAASQISLAERLLIADDFVTPVFETQFPLRRITLSLTNRTDDVGKTAVSEGARRDGQHVIAAVDMERFHGTLLPALDALGNHLAGSAAADARRAARRVQDEAGLADLGSYLSQPLPNEARAAQQAATQALHQTISARHGGRGLESLCGLSFQRSGGRLG